MNTKAIISLAVAATTLGGCASTYSANEGFIDQADFGEANRQTFAAMVVNPDPEYTEPLEGDAQAAADAAERVRERQVVQPRGEDTTQSGGGGGG